MSPDFSIINNFNWNWKFRIRMGRPLAFVLWGSWPWGPPFRNHMSYYMTVRVNNIMNAPYGALFFLIFNDFEYKTLF